jgi:hypothetical protein
VSWVWNSFDSCVRNVLTKGLNENPISNAFGAENNSAMDRGDLTKSERIHRCYRPTGFRAAATRRRRLPTYPRPFRIYALHDRPKGQLRTRRAVPRLAKKKCGHSNTRGGSAPAERHFSFSASLARWPGLCWLGRVTGGRRTSRSWPVPALLGARCGCGCSGHPRLPTAAWDRPPRLTRPGDGVVFGQDHNSGRGKVDEPTVSKFRNRV